MDYLLVFVGGTIFGVVLVLTVVWLRRSQERELTQQLFNSIGTRGGDDVELILARVRESFQALSLEALSKSTDEFLKLAGERLSGQTKLGENDLETKKQLIDSTLNVMKEDLTKLRDVITNLEKDREQKFGEVSTLIRNTAEETRRLQDTTAELKSTISGTKTRGSWGERMAEDVLNILGLQEGISYRKQTAMGNSTSIPDFTFFLPEGKIINMDVKFPLNNYQRYMESDLDSEKEKFKTEFLKDVKKRIKEVGNRGYIDPVQGTLDYLIIFIPNEQVFSFINQEDDKMLDEALRNKVILCSPLTLYGILAVIRQAVLNFRLEKATAEIAEQFGLFSKQWEMFVAAFEKVGKKIEETKKEFDALQITRVNQLEKPLKQIEILKDAVSGVGTNDTKIAE